MTAVSWLIVIDPFAAALLIGAVLGAVFSAFVIACLIAPDDTPERIARPFAATGRHLIVLARLARDHMSAGEASQ